jgi:hypothetical protein
MEAFLAALATFVTEVNAATGYSTISTLLTTSGTQWDSGLLPTIYNDLQILILGVSFTASANLSMAIGDGASSFATAQAISSGNTGASDLFFGSVDIRGYQMAGGLIRGGACPLSADRTTGTHSVPERPWRLAAGIKYLRFSGGTGDAGSIVIRGRQ